MPAKVTKVELQGIEPDEQGEDTSEIPEDFRLTWIGDNGEAESLDVEAVLLATGDECDIEFGFQTPAPYLFRVGKHADATPEESLVAGLHQIVAIYAEMAGRADLDLYRPRRG